MEMRSKFNANQLIFQKGRKKSRVFSYCLYFESEGVCGRFLNKCLLFNLSSKGRKVNQEKEGMRAVIWKLCNPEKS